MKIKLIALGVLMLIAALFVIVQLSDDDTQTEGEDNPEVVTWAQLDRLDYRTKNMPRLLEKLNGRFVRVPGFVVPLEDDFTSVSEFLLVPDPGSCIHVPPPPPNQMIYVKMKADQRVILHGLPVWVTGKLKIETVRSPYGLVAYSIHGKTTDVFRSWKQFDKRKRQ